MVSTVAVCLLIALESVWIPFAVGDEITPRPTFPKKPGYDKNDERQWEQLRGQLPTGDMDGVGKIIDELTKLKDKCDPKTRFSASVVRLLISANFRYEELGGAFRRIQRYEQASAYDPGGLPGRTGP